MAKRGVSENPDANRIASLRVALRSERNSDPARPRQGWLVWCIWGSFMTFLNHYFKIVKLFLINILPKISIRGTIIALFLFCHMLDFGICRTFFERGGRMAQFDRNNEPTKKALHTYLKLSITMCLWLSIFILLMIPIVQHFITEKEINWEFIKFIGLGAGFALALFGLTLALSLFYSHIDKPVNSRLRVQHCIAVCPRCKKQFDYLGSSVKMRPGYDNGAVDCPDCGFHVEHNTENIVEILDK